MRIEKEGSGDHEITPDFWGVLLEPGTHKGALKMNVTLHTSILAGIDYV